MKRMLLCTTLLLILTVPVSYSLVDPSGLLGLWHLDGNTDDSSGNGRHGVISDPIHVIPIGGGISGMAYRFDGMGNINVQDLDFSGGQYTVNLWIRTTEPAVEASWRMAIGKADIPAGDMTFEIVLGDGRLEGGANAPIYVVWDNGAGVVNLWNASVNGRDGNWHLATATYTTGNQKFYVDGVLVATGSYAGALPLVADGVKIGGLNGFGPYHHPWIGDIDEVSIYSRALSDSEVLELFRNPGGIPEPSTLTGHVTDKNTGNPIVQALVIALQSPTKMTRKTDGNGFYEIKDLSPGDWLVLCWKRGYQFALKKVTLAAGETKTVDFSLKPKASSRDDDIPPEFRDAVNAGPAALSPQHKLIKPWGAIKRP